MTTETPKTLARAAEPTRLPADAVLRFHEHFAPEDAKQLKAYYAACYAFEDRKADVMNVANEQLEDYANGSVRNLLEDMATIRHAWETKTADVVAEFVSLGWRKRDLLLSAGPAHAKQTAHYREVYEKFVADELANLKAMGVNHAMPASGKNAPAAERQLRAEAERREWVLAAKADLNLAIDAERVHKSQLEAVPTYASYTITWPEVDSRVAAVAQLIGLARTTAPTPHQFSDRGRKIVRDLGLENAPLLIHHASAIANIDMHLQRDWCHPLMGVTAKQLPAIREFVAELPKTAAVLKYLAETANGLPAYNL